MENDDRAFEEVVSRAFLTAHLLTAGAEQAEAAVTEALRSWSPDRDSHETLFEKVLEAAIRIRTGLPMPAELTGVRSNFPVQLRAVLELPTLLRQCFILRVLVGLRSQDCVRLLNLRSSQVAEYTSAAIESLAATRYRGCRG